MKNIGWGWELEWAVVVKTVQELIMVDMGLVEAKLGPLLLQRNICPMIVPTKKRKFSEDAKAEMDEKDRLFKKTCDETDF